jgi:hypothetical protein
MTQTARPASDITTTNWTTAPLFSKVNDNSDATTIRNANGITTACEVKLASLTDPASSTGHIMSVRGFATGSSAGEALEFVLVQGTTVKATRAGATLQRTTPITTTYTLTAGEADSITDYTDLRIRVRMSTGAATEFLTIHDVWLDVPDAPVFVSGTDAGIGADTASVIVPAPSGKTHVIVAGV